jgi:hypothetical protein
MSYEGLGQATLLRTGFAPATPGPVNRAPTAPMVDVGVNAAMIAALGSWMSKLYATSNNNRSMAPLFLAGALLSRAKPNAFGKIDPAAVAAALNTLSPNLKQFVTQSIVVGGYRNAVNPTPPVLVGVSIEKLLADIAAGKYAGHAPTPTLATSPLRPGGLLAARTFAAQKVAVANAAQTTATAQAQQAQTPVQVASAQQAQAVANQAASEAAAAQAAAQAAESLSTQPDAQVQCTDGYFRDASGLCVPNAAPPSDSTAPDFTPVGPVTIAPVLTTGPSSSPSRWAIRPMGVDLKWWVVGAAGVGIAAIAFRSSHKVTANKRRRKKA